MKFHAKEIIDVANRFGVSLKLETEAFLMENVMELLLYAESKNCALLKEAAMDYRKEQGHVTKSYCYWLSCDFAASRSLDSASPTP